MTLAQEFRRLKEEAEEVLESHDGAQGAEDFGQYENDPVGFMRDVLGADPWRVQEEIAASLLSEPLVTVRSCHASGKDWLAARLALWWCYALRGLVILTGPTRQQIEEILMRGEVRDAFRGASELPGELHVRALRPAEEGRAGVLAKTATGVSSLTGFHDARVLFVITEAQDPDIGHAWDAAFACTTGAEDRILTLGNPTQRSGRFYQAHQGSSDWRSFQIAASDIPNVRRGETVVPGLLTREGVRRFAREYGEGSGFYKSRVLAEFPEQSEEGLIRRSWLEAAADHHESGGLPVPESAEPVVAVDVGRRGPDKTIAAIRRGPVVREIREVGNRDPTRTAEDVQKLLVELGFYTGDSFVMDGEYRKVEKRGTVVVDTLGVGARVADPLQEAGFNVVEYKGSRSPGRSEKYANLRAESYWHLRNRLEDGEIALPRDEGLFEELLALSWAPTGKGKIQMEAKDEVKKRIRRSPDRADAVAMALWPQPASKAPPTADEIGILQK